MFESIKISPKKNYPSLKGLVEVIMSSFLSWIVALTNNSCLSSVAFASEAISLDDHEHVSAPNETTHDASHTSSMYWKKERNCVKLGTDLSQWIQADGSFHLLLMEEIQRSPVDREFIPLFIGFYTYIPGGCLGFLNHQHYDHHFWWWVSLEGGVLKKC